MHWKICNHYDIETPKKWYEHKPLPVVYTPKMTILWDFPIRADRTIKANRPDIAIKHKQNKTCQLKDMSVIFLLTSNKNHTSYCKGTWFDQKGNTEIC